MAKRILAMQESDLRMNGDLAMNIQRVLPVTQADIDAAAAVGQGWVVEQVFEVSLPIDNTVGQTWRVIKVNSITPGQNVKRVMIVPNPYQRTVVVSGIPPLSLVGAVADSLTSLKAFGGTALNTIPSEYTQVEYVERPSGNTEQYIETNWKPNLAKNIRVQGIATYMGTITDYRPILLGNYTGIRSSTLNIEFDGRTQNNLRIYTLKENAGTGGDLQVGPFATNDVVDFDIQITGSNGALAVSATVGGTTITGSGTIENVGEQTLYNMMLFKDHRATTTSASKVASRIHYLKATEDDKVVFELIPVKRKSDSVVGFYDKVSGQFLTNQGTGSFTAGNEVLPTPSDPMDIYCNNGKISVLDHTNWNVITNPTSQTGQGMFINSDGKLQKANDRGAGVFIPVTVGKQYTLLINKKNTALGSIIRYGQSNNGDLPNSAEQLLDWYRGAIEDMMMISFTAKRPYFVMQLAASLVEAGGIDEAIEVIEAAGDNETIAIRTRNLANVATDIDGKYIGVDGTIGTNATSCYSDIIPVVAGETYIWSCICGNSGTSNNKRVHAYVDGVWQEQIWLAEVSAGVAWSKSFTVPAGCNGIRISHWNTDTETQVELGSTKTAYIAYNDSTATANNLFAINTYKDVQEIITGATTHNIGVRMFNGTEDWTCQQASTSGNYYAYVSLTGINTSIGDSTPGIICSHYNPVLKNTFTTDNTCCVRLNKNGFAFTDNAHATNVTVWKAWLATQYAAGTPVIIVYPLATPFEEVAPIAQSMTVVDGDNTVSLTQQGMTPLTLEATYTAGVSVTITEIENANIGNDVDVVIA